MAFSQVKFCVKVIVPQEPTHPVNKMGPELKCLFTEASQYLFTEASQRLNTVNNQREKWKFVVHFVPQLLNDLSKT